MSMSSSPGLRLVLRGLTNRSANGIFRRPEGPATVTDASSAINVGPLSIDGTQVTRLPPSVPRLRVCTAPMVWAASTNAGNMSPMIGELIISACVTNAPMCSPSSTTAISLSSPSREMSMTISGLCAACLSSTSRSVPPARILALAPCSPSSATAWSTFFAATYPNAFIQPVSVTRRRLCAATTNRTSHEGRESASRSRQMTIHGGRAALPVPKSS